MTREEQIIEASQLYAKHQQKPFKDGVMIVSYFDEMQYNPETGEEPMVEIRVDEIDIK